MFSDQQSAEASCPPSLHSHQILHCKLLVQVYENGLEHCDLRADWRWNWITPSFQAVAMRPECVTLVLARFLLQLNSALVYSWDKLGFLVRTSKTSSCHLSCPPIHHINMLVRIEVPGFCTCFLSGLRENQNL